jgi:hypothetical protein
MKIKLNRGPLKNKYYDVVDGSREFVVQEPVQWDRSMWQNFDPSEPMKVRRGTYHRSNVTQKNGAVVFEWMGWKE